MLGLTSRWWETARRAVSHHRDVSPSISSPLSKHLPGARQRLDELLDSGSFQEIDAGLSSTDPLGFRDVIPYPLRLSWAQRATGLTEAVVTGEGQIHGHPCVVAVSDFGFLGGSMGTVVGEKVTRAIERAERHRLPFVTVVASGGARMQEGMLSLVQMAKTTAAATRLRESGLPFIAVLTDPTTGGVLASYVSQADVILAEPGARIGFAGPRVVRELTGQELPPGFPSAEYLLQCGLIDAVVPREALRAVLGDLLGAKGRRERRGRLDHEAHETATKHTKRETTKGIVQGEAPDRPDETRFAVGDLDETRLGVGDRGFRSAHRLGRRAIASISSMLFVVSRFVCFVAVSCASWSKRPLRPSVPPPLSEASCPSAAASLQPWATVQEARHPERPTAVDYLARLVRGFVELHGDRISGDDAALIGGVGEIAGRRALILAQERGHAEESQRHGGRMGPAGYRKATRLIRLASRLGLPIVTFVDTPGAELSVEAEAGGLAQTISDCLAALLAAPVPVVAALIGEGGSGGALALGVGDRVLIQERAVDEVIAPEGAAAILYHTRTRASELAESLKLTAPDALRLGVVDSIVPEPPGGARSNPDLAATLLGDAISAALDQISTLSPEEIVDARYEKYRRMGSSSIKSG